MEWSEIEETYEFELQIAKLTIKEHWKIYPQRLALTSAKKSFANKHGDILISLPTYENSRDYQALRKDIRSIFADLHSGFFPRHKFLWQRIAKKMGAIQETTAEDACECELCGMLTPLVMVKRCATCYRIETAVKEAPHIARKVLEGLK